MENLIEWMEECIKTLKAEKIQDDYQKGFTGGYSQCLAKAKQFKSVEAKDDLYRGICKKHDWIVVADKIQCTKCDGIREGESKDRTIIESKTSE